ncbi:MAG: ABC transporter permease [bacterium]
MFKNYLKIALRNIKRQKVYSFINIAGLAIGMACTILILLWVQDELSYDRFHENANEIYRIIGNFGGTLIPAGPGPLAGFLKEEIPEIINATRLYPASGVFVHQGHKFRESGLYVEPEFLKIFTFPMVKGDPKSALNDLGSIVMTEDMAKKYFGDGDPMGKFLKQDNQFDVKVTGVIKNIPHNSSLNLKFDYLQSFDIVKFWKQPDSWMGSSDFQAYVLLAKNSALEVVNQKITDLRKRHFSTTGYNFFLQPLTRMHLYSDFKFDAPHGDIKYVTIFTLVAFFVLVTACINFMNLATARFSKRAKEVGLRKVVGANRRQLIKQFIGESIAFSFVALPFTFLLVELVLPGFKNLSAKPLAVNYSDYRFLLGALGLALFTGFISGSYPALFLSSFKPVTILKGLPLQSSLTHSGSKVGFRKILVVVQFALSIMVIIGTMVVSKQVNYLRNKRLGFDKENLIYVWADKDLAKVYESMKHELLQSPRIKSVTASNEMITALGTMIGDVQWEGQKANQRVKFQIIKVNDDYLDTYKMEMAEGRFYSRVFATDATQAFVVNETAVEAMEMRSPIGKRLKAYGRDGRIIGVVKDFHFRSLHDKINPLILNLGTFGKEYDFFHLTVRINPGNIPETLKFIEGVWQKHVPESPFEYHFLDETLDKLYTTEQRLGKIFGYLTFLTIFVSCLGLFGLATFLAEQKTKEIGIRKVLGSSVTGIVVLLSKVFMKWVLISNVIAWPIAYLAMKKWLQNFAYQVNIEFWTFVFSGLTALIIALMTVSYQSVKAALVNPVEALRYE